MLLSLFQDDAIAHAFSAEQTIAHMLAFEVALAQVQAEMNIIPVEAAAQIERTAWTFKADLADIQSGIEKSGVPTLALITQFRAAVGEAYGAYLHWGATTQDVMDTALILQLRICLDVLEANLDQTIRQLARMAKQHRQTLMPGRTHSQQASPITFGFKVANWIAPLLRHCERLDEMKPRLLKVQFGGAVGTLSVLGEHGLTVQKHLAARLKLNVPLITWHNQRDTLVELAGWLSMLTGSLAKMAQDVILMAQSEIGEVKESDDTSRGDSSTLPQKRNPVISEIIVAAARHNANLLASMHQAAIHEHERATGAWQLEWLSLPQMLHLTAVALHKAVFLSRNLVVDEKRMQDNVTASQGLMLAEAVMFALIPITGRNEAKQIVRASALEALKDNRHLVDVVRQQVNAEIDWETLKEETHYLGQAEACIERILMAVEGRGND